jgi:hypothetical protein
MCIILDVRYLSVATAFLSTGLQPLVAQFHPPLQLLVKVSHYRALPLAGLTCFIPIEHLPSLDAAKLSVHVQDNNIYILNHGS